MGPRTRPCAVADVLRRQPRRPGAAPVRVPRRGVVLDRRPPPDQRPSRRPRPRRRHPRDQRRDQRPRRSPSAIHMLSRHRRAATYPRRTRDREGTRVRTRPGPAGHRLELWPCLDPDHRPRRGRATHLRGRPVPGARHAHRRHRLDRTVPPRAQPPPPRREVHRGRDAPRPAERRAAGDPVEERHPVDRRRVRRRRQHRRPAEQLPEGGVPLDHLAGLRRRHGVPLLRDHGVLGRRRAAVLDRRLGVPALRVLDLPRPALHTDPTEGVRLRHRRRAHPTRTRRRARHGITRRCTTDRPRRSRGGHT